MSNIEVNSLVPKSLVDLRKAIRANHMVDETDLINLLVAEANISIDEHKRIFLAANKFVKNIRADDRPSLMEVFLAEYGLSTDEGVALMCLAEALLRVPDSETIDDLIKDKIAPSSWGEHLGKSSSSLVNASTWALMLTGKVLESENSSNIAGSLHQAVKRLGEPVIRLAVKRAMKEMGNQFVLGESIKKAVHRGEAKVKQGYTYSYDMLGEASLSAKDANDYFNAYKNAIEFLAKNSNSTDIRENPGISIKLSALHPRYEQLQKPQVMQQLTKSVLSLALIAKQANIGLNIDAEEADRLEISLDVIEAVLSEKSLAGWDGFGVVVQAYGKRASYVIDWLYALAKKHSRKIMVRLVKGAYWDSEIKQAQIDGVADFPVFTRKSATDVSYICCAKKLLNMADRIYPQFATHNAHTVCAILEMAKSGQSYEFQSLHGMGEAMYRQLRQDKNLHCRIYAPVGVHSDLLAYLVRRLLENGANSSFVNQIIDKNVPAEIVASDPFARVFSDLGAKSTSIKKPADLFAPVRVNSHGWNLQNIDDLKRIELARAPFENKQWNARSILAVKPKGELKRAIFNPANSDEKIGSVIEATLEDVENALDNASDWQAVSPNKRAAILNRAADLFEENFAEIFAILTKEAGKNLSDAVSELREAVDFLRYYATQCNIGNDRVVRGLIVCISPWNFPLSIFTGQIAAPLAAGNGVLAKPAEATPIISNIAVQFLHEAGVPKTALQLLLGSGAIIGKKLLSDRRIAGTCFTGSTKTAQIINVTMANSISPKAPLIAETGGLNAMIVDSTALHEQAIKDIVVSAFQSAGQRCSALRILYLQEDIAKNFKEMLFGAMDELIMGNPWEFTTDIGPIISEQARNEIKQYIDVAAGEGRLLKSLNPPQKGNFIAPSVISISNILEMKEEIFGPVLHLATFKSNEINQIIEDINASGYGLTFGIHTRIDNRVEQVTSKLKVGNMYINRNQIGAVVGSQPFGGEGLSGTGPKAGGRDYVQRFTKSTIQPANKVLKGKRLSVADIEAELNKLPDVSNKKLQIIDLPGPTGESNRLSYYPRGTILCLGPTLKDAKKQAMIAKKQGCNFLIACPKAKGLSGFVERKDLTVIMGFDALALWSEESDLRLARKALAKRSGIIIPLLSEYDMEEYCKTARHICIDTTASGGNASLLASTE